jgi:uncharacterized membrane protein
MTIESQPPPPESDETTSQPVSIVFPRPASVTLLALGVLTIAALNLARCILALRYWVYLDALTSVSPLYLALSGLFWGLSGLPLFWGLMRGKRRAPALMRAMALTYALYYWLDQVFIKEYYPTGAEGGARLLLPGNWPFSAVLTFLLLVFTVWTLQRQAAKDFFGEMNEPQPENETPA